MLIHRRDPLAEEQVHVERELHTFGIRVPFFLSLSFFFFLGRGLRHGLPLNNAKSPGSSRSDVPSSAPPLATGPPNSPIATRLGYSRPRLPASPRGRERACVRGGGASEAVSGLDVRGTRGPFGTAVGWIVNIRGKFRRKPGVESGRGWKAAVIYVCESVCEDEAARFYTLSDKKILTVPALCHPFFSPF